jgi:hypothetical protein
VLLGHDSRDRVHDQLAGADGVVVAGDVERDRVRVAVGVDQADDRDLQALGLAHGDHLGLEVDHEHRVRRALHVAHPAERVEQFLAFLHGADPLARGQQLEGAALGPVEQLVQPLDPLRDRVEVREQAAEPALVHVRHAGRLGGVRDRVAGLLLRADEQHCPPASRHFGRELLRLREQPLGLL